jgi:hypothetical protein
MPVVAVLDCSTLALAHPPNSRTIVVTRTNRGWALNALTTLNILLLSLTYLQKDNLNCGEAIWLK